MILCTSDQLASTDFSKQGEAGGGGGGGGGGIVHVYTYVPCSWW